MRKWIVVALLMTCAAGCKRESGLKLALNWVPEPEFGGFYSAQQIGAFKKHGLDLKIEPGGAGAPIVQRVVAGEVQFGIASADEVIIARSHGQDVVALFAVYQTCPQAIMVHESRKLQSLADVFAQPGTIAMEPGLPYRKFLEKKFSGGKAKIVPYNGNAPDFLTDPNFSQQCFITSEPLTAKRHGADPKTFLVAEAGYNPYTAVVITRGDYAKQNAATVRAMIEACREGWQAYLNDPKPANDVMRGLNQTMDPETFAAAAQAQKPLIEASPLGSMTVERWDTLAKQLVDLGIIDHAPAGKECMMP